MATVDVDLGAYKLGWHDEIEYEFKPEKGLNEDIIRQMSAMKGEPQWMLEQRLKAYKRFLRKPMPQWGGGRKAQRDRFRRHLLLHQAFGGTVQGLGHGA